MSGRPTAQQGWCFFGLGLVRVQCCRVLKGDLPSKPKFPRGGQSKRERIEHRNLESAMNPKRKQRLYLTVFLFLVAGGLTALLIQISGENMNMFYPPKDVVSGKAPIGQRLRAGGMVMEGSVVRGAQDLGVTFVLTDHQGADFSVRYTGILPDLFREGQGILVEGQLDDSGVLEATEVLAKHDENYMPPELMELQTAEQQPAAKPVMPAYPSSSMPLPQSASDDS